MGPSRHLSRRAFARWTTALTAGATIPILNEAALAQMSYMGEPPPDAVLLNANENPLGPCPEALEAMNAALKSGGRYLFGETMRLSRVFAGQEGLRPDYVQSFAGSSDTLHRTILAFCSPTRSYVAAEPTFESGERPARHVGAKIVSVPLRKDYAHDVRVMLERAGKDAGVFYLCNPNNPTGTPTPREDIEFLLANKPAGSIVLLDEAYIHFTEIKSGIDLVAAGKDVVVLRTFSKIYGMAGLRAGFAVARPDLLEKIRPYGTGFLPTTGMVGAAASLTAKNLVPERRAWLRNIRESVFEWMSKRDYSFTQGITNCFMVDVKRPGREIISALAARKVYVGRTWPCWPTHVRITVGTRDEMQKFQTAFEQVMV